MFSTLGGKRRASRLCRALTYFLILLILTVNIGCSTVGGSGGREGTATVTRPDSMPRLLDAGPMLPVNPMDIDTNSPLGSVQIGRTAPQRALTRSNLSFRPKQNTAPIKALQTLPVGAPLALPTLPPTAADLQASVDVQLTPEIDALANSLGNHPLRIYEYVRNQCAFEPFYHGSLKGSQETLLQQSGNDYDLASLLIALLRSADIPATYGRGFVMVPKQKALNWIGVSDLQTAANILSTAGFKASVIAVNNDIQALEVELVWVEAAIPGGLAGTYQRAVFAPAFKQHQITTGRDLQAEAGGAGTSIDTIVQAGIADLTVPLIDEINTDLVTEAFEARQDQIKQYLQGQGNVKLRDIVGGKSILPETYTELPQILPLDLVPSFIPERFSTVAQGDRHYVRYQTAGMDVTLPMPDVASKRVTLSYDGADWLGLQPGAVDLIPQLKTNGTVRGQGQSVPVGYYYGFAVDFMKGTTFVDRVVHTVTTGGHYAIATDTQRVSAQKLSASVARAKAASANSPAQSDEVLGELLHSLGLFYYAYQDIAIELYAGPKNATVFHDINEALLSRDLALTEDGLIHGSYGIDAPRNITSLFSNNGSPTFNAAAMLIAIGYSSSALEHTIFEGPIGSPGTSTIRCLTWAAEEECPIYGINSQNLSSVLAALDQPASIEQTITEQVNSGLTVIIPKEPLLMGHWFGTGWVALDPVTGAGGFLLSGGTSGGSEIFTTLTPDESRALTVDHIGFMDAFLNGVVFSEFDQTKYETTGLTLSNIAGKFVAGLFGYGDVLDVSAGAQQMYQTGGQDGKANVVFGIVGIAPGLGEAIKGLRAGSRASDAARPIAGLSDEAVDALRAEMAVLEEAQQFVINSAGKRVSWGDFLLDPINGVQTLTSTFTRTTTKGHSLTGDFRLVGTVEEARALVRNYGFDPSNFSTANKGAFLEKYGHEQMLAKGFMPVVPLKSNPTANGLDGLYLDSAGNAYIAEAKFATSNSEFGYGKFATTVQGAPAHQLTKTWNEANAPALLDEAVKAGTIDTQQAAKILLDIQNDTVGKFAIFGRQAKTATGRGRTLSYGLVNNLSIGGASANPMQTIMLDLPVGTFHP